MSYSTTEFALQHAHLRGNGKFSLFVRSSIEPSSVIIQRALSSSIRHLYTLLFTEEDIHPRKSPYRPVKR